MTNTKADFLAMKPSQRDTVQNVIVSTGLLVSLHKNGAIWRDTMKRKAIDSLGRVRRFYRYLSRFDDGEIDKFLNAFAE